MIYDAAIIGAGPAGSTAARLLARAGWSVVVVEKREFPRRKVCGEFISATSLPLLSSRDIREAFAGEAGPDVTRVALFAGERAVAADMPPARHNAAQWGRALGREKLDTLLLEAAVRAGAHLRQPWTVASVAAAPGHYVSTLERDHAVDRIQSRIVILANGSWEKSPLPGQTTPAHRPSDLLAFKAHFTASDLPPGTMPLLAFPGGYGGMVHSDQGRVSFSCCTRRDVLERCRAETGARAGDAVLRHIVANCAGVRDALARAELSGPWLSSGPIRPGIRWFQRDGIFAVGNAAAEAHPIIAEGISMAMQSAALLAARLIAEDDAVLSGVAQAQLGRAYAADWKRQFGLRLSASAALAKLAMRPATAAMMASVVKGLPSLLTWGARVSGKTADHQRGDVFPSPSQRAIN